MTKTAVDFDMHVLDAIYRRRSVRSYRADRLDEATVRRLLDAAVHAPTGMHAEPWAFVVVQDPFTLRRLSDRAKTLVLAESTADHDLLRGHTGEADRRELALLRDPKFNIFFDASTLIVVCAKPLGAFVTADCWLAAENIMLAATTLGLGSCCIGFAIPALRTTDVKSELHIPHDVHPVAAIVVGVPRSDTPATSRRKPEILSWVHAPTP